MSKTLLGLSLIGLLIVAVIGIFILRNNLKSATQIGTQNETENGTTEGGAIGKAHETKAQADLKSVETSLIIYFNINNIYPNTSSFSDMAAELENANVMKTEPKEPTQDYLYKYCSSNGTDFLLEAEYNNDIIMSIGDANCSPGE